MRVVVVEAPTAPVFEPVELLTQLRLTDDDADQYPHIAALIAGAADHLAGPTGWLGRSLSPQTLEARLDRLDGAIRLPCPPVCEIETISYLDPAGAAQTLAPSAYEVVGDEVSPAFGMSWPSTRIGGQAVRIRYRAGYPDGLPPALKVAIMLMVADLYAFRETAVIGMPAAAVPMSVKVESLLDPFRVFC